MQAFLHVARRMTTSNTSLLITGETGVGKEWLARAIHGESPRNTGPFVAINCGALPEGLLESELFGHEKGAFTGATRSKRGHFEAAEGGSLFLDEIGEIPLHLQVRLLRVIQAREVQRLGAEQPLRVDVRILAATNRNLLQEVACGNFRRDLYYRLSVVSLAVPPLRERREDIPDLIERYLTHFQSQLPNSIQGVDPHALQALIEYNWPGNVRELINVIERAVLLCEGERISRQDLPDVIARNDTLPAPILVTPDADQGLPASWLQLPLKEAQQKLRDRFEQAYLVGLLQQTRGRVGETARRAGISSRSLYTRMLRLGLRKEDFRSP